MSPSQYQPAGLYPPGYLATQRELRKYQKYEKLIGRPPVDFAEAHYDPVRCQPLVDALWEQPLPFLNQPAAHAERFWPLGLEMFGVHGPHLYKFLKFLAEKQSDQLIGSPSLNFAQMRRILSKLLHDHIGTMMTMCLKL